MQAVKRINALASALHLAACLHSLLNNFLIIPPAVLYTIWSSLMKGCTNLFCRNSFTKRSLGLGCRAGVPVQEVAFLKWSMVAGKDFLAPLWGHQQSSVVSYMALLWSSSCFFIVIVQIVLAAIFKSHVRRNYRIVGCSPRVNMHVS